MTSTSEYSEATSSSSSDVEERMKEDFDILSVIMESSDEDEADNVCGELLPPGFAHPKSVKYPVMADYIEPGDVKICKGATLYHPSRFYVVLPEHWPEAINKFAASMTKSYQELEKGPGRHEWMISTNDLAKVGNVVAVYRDDEKEFARAEIVKNKINVLDSGKKHRLRLIDFGEYYEKEEFHLALLMKQYAKQPQFVVKCRHELSFFYEKYHTRKAKWGKAVKREFYKALSDKLFTVRFLRRVERLGEEPCWEVIIEGFADDKPIPDARGEELIVKKVIKKAMGSYEHNPRGA